MAVLDQLTVREKHTNINICTQFQTLTGMKDREDEEGEICLVFWK